MLPSDWRELDFPLIAGFIAISASKGFIVGKMTPWIRLRWTLRYRRIQSALQICHLAAPCISSLLKGSVLILPTVFDLIATKIATQSCLRTGQSTAIVVGVGVSHASLLSRAMIRSPKILPRKQQPSERQFVVGGVVYRLHRPELRQKEAAAAAQIDAKKPLLCSPTSVILIL